MGKMKDNTIHLLFLIIATPCVAMLSSCVSNEKDNQSGVGLAKEEIAYYTKLKEDYYQQRFVNSNTNTYYASDAYSIGADNPESSVYCAPDAIMKIKVNSVDDLKVHLTYYVDEEITIVSFKYQEMGDSGAWFSIGAHIDFVEETKICDVVFRGNNFAPEVFYKGKFYYIQEAYKMGLFTMDNPNMIITSHYYQEKNGQNIEYISGHMPGTLINI